MITKLTPPHPLPSHLPAITWLTLQTNFTNLIIAFKRERAWTDLSGALRQLYWIYCSHQEDILVSCCSSTNPISL